MFGDLGAETSFLSANFSPDGETYHNHVFAARLQPCSYAAAMNVLNNGCKLQWLRLKLGMKLASDEIGMIRRLPRSQHKYRPELSQRFATLRPPSALRIHD